MHHFGLTALVSISMAVLFVLVGARRPEGRTKEKIASLLADGAASGPLLLIFISPFTQILGIGPDFYDEVFKNETTILWWAVTYAFLSLLWKLI